MMSLQNPWNVLIATEYAGVPMISARRLRIETTPDSVKVRARIESGEASVLRNMFAIRSVRICVFPVPGPATTITGPSTASTASRCAAFSFV
jgi:hypothetical protein